MSKRNFLLALTSLAISIVIAATPTALAAGSTFNINVTCENGSHQQKSIQQSSSTVANINISCGNGKQGPPGPPGPAGKNGTNGQNGKDAPPATICLQTANITCPVVTINSTSSNNDSHSSSMPIIPLIPK